MIAGAASEKNNWRNPLGGFVYLVVPNILKNERTRS
jgi:hypothetical protein